jgi:hypothetical protein
MHVVTTRRQGKGKEYVAHLLRRSYREGGRVKKETLANLSHLPDDLVELIRRRLQGERFLPAADAFELERSLPHGHAACVLALARRLGLPRLLDRAPSKERDRALAMICQRLLAPGSKLACTRQLQQSTLAEELGVVGADTDDLYAAMDWLVARQEAIEGRLARRHLAGGSLVLYDVSSSYFEGRCCPLARRGYSRDRRRGSLQVVYGLLWTARAGRSRSRSSTARSTTTRRCSRRWRSCGAASASDASCSSSTAAWSPRPTWRRSAARKRSPGSRR